MVERGRQVDRNKSGYHLHFFFPSFCKTETIHICLPSLLEPDLPQLSFLLSASKVTDFYSCLSYRRTYQLSPFYSICLMQSANNFFLLCIIEGPPVLSVDVEGQDHIPPLLLYPPISLAIADWFRDCYGHYGDESF